MDFQLRFLQQRSFCKYSLSRNISCRKRTIKDDEEEAYPRRRNKTCHQISDPQVVPNKIDLSESNIETPKPEVLKFILCCNILQLNTINIFIYLEQKYNIFIEIRQILLELYNILRKKIIAE